MPGDPAVPEVEERGPDARSEEEVSSGETEPSEDVSSEEDTVSGEDASAPDDVSGVEDAAIEPAPECTESTPCNDLDPCTEDLCDDGVCVHTPIPECCTTDGQCTMEWHVPSTAAIPSPIPARTIPRTISVV